MLVKKSHLIALALATTAVATAASDFLGAKKARHLPVLPADRCSGDATRREAVRVKRVVDPLIKDSLATTGVPGAAFIYVHDDCVVYSSGYGVSDLSTRQPVSVDETVWPIASVTKIFTATLAMQLVGDGRLSLGTDINTELRRAHVPIQKLPPVNLAHLLSHTAAFDELPGRQFDGIDQQDLGKFLQPRLQRYRKPGERTAYSSYGIALVGLAIEDVSGRSFNDVLTKRLLVPAGLSQSWVMNQRGDERGVATPYNVEGGKATALPYEWYVTTPTSSMVASTANMGRFLRLHLNNGRLDGTQIVPAWLVRQMHSPQSTNHSDLLGWGYGFQLQRVNGLLTAEHGGDIGGFSSLFTLIPERDAGFFVVNHGEGSNLRFRLKQALMDELFPASPMPVPAPSADLVPTLRRDYAGRYLSSLACQSCEMRSADVFEVSVDNDGAIRIWGRRWIPSGRDRFVSDDGRALLGFSRGEDGRIDGVTGGSWRTAIRLRP